MDRKLIALGGLVIAVVIVAVLVMGGDDPVPEEKGDEAANGPARGSPEGPPPVADPEPEPGPREPPSVEEPAPAPEPEPQPQPKEPKKDAVAGAVAANTQKLDDATLDLKMSDAPLLDILQAIGEKTDLYFYVHPNVDAKLLTKTISFDFKGTPARTLLRFIRKVGLPKTKWVVTAEGVELRPE